MKRMTYYFIPVLVAVLFYAQNVKSQRLAAKRLGSVKSKEFKITVDEKERTYRLFVPGKSKVSKKPLPFVFVLHGGGKDESSENTLRFEHFTQFTQLAEKERFIVCYPQGYKGNWNDGRGVSFIAAHKENVDDIKFFRKIIAEVSKQHQVDQSRIYSTGISNGAFMSHRLAAEASDMVCAIAPLVGGMAHTDC